MSVAEQTTLSGPRAYQALAIASGLRMYAKCRMQVSAAWTPSAMMRMAAALTGNTYKRNEYVKAATDLRALCGLDAEGK
jgi:hypothetical protein